VDGVGAGRVVEVVDIGREHRWRGCRADAEDRQHEDGGRYADEAKRAARATTARVPCGRLRTEPSVQTLPLRQVLDAIGDSARLRRAKPATLLPFEQALDRRPGLEGDEQERQRHRAQNTLVVAARRALEQ